MLVPVDLPEIVAEARSDPLALPGYGGRAWCRLEAFVFCLWAEMQPDQAVVKVHYIVRQYKRVDRVCYMVNYMVR